MQRNGEREGNHDWLREERAGDHYLPTIAITCVPHPNIPNLLQHCFEYLEPWEWSPVTELVETGRWFYGNSSGSQLRSGGK
jgi:hypothetical protein